jgi:hypothetical protein
MHQTPRLRARDPLAIPAGCCDTAVKTIGEFERYKWAPKGGFCKKSDVIVCRHFGANTRCHLDPCSAQHVKSGSVHTWITVLKRTNHMAYTHVD